MINLIDGAFTQTAYVTNDLDQALATFAGLGVTRFLELRDLAFPVGSGVEAHCHVALAIAGGREIEIIEPIGGAVDVYRQALSGTVSGFQMHFHHVAQALPSLDALEAIKADVRSRGIAIPIDAAAPQGMTYFYADLRTPLGYHVEYIYPSADYLAAMAGAIPVN